MHWGNIGSAAAGLAALIAAVFAVVYALVKKQGPAWLQAVRDRERAQADAARAQEGLAHEQAEQIRLARRRGLYGWSDNIETYTVALVTEPAELEQAARELARGGASDYMVVRVAESNEPYGNTGRAHSLRQMVGQEGLISKPPSVGEREALERGLAEMGIMSKAATIREREDLARRAEQRKRQLA